MLVIRVGKDYIKLMLGALALITKIYLENVRLRILGISGSIKGEEKRVTKCLVDFKDISEKMKNTKTNTKEKEKENNIK